MADAKRQLDLMRKAAAGNTVALALLLADSREWLCEYIARRIPVRLQAALDADDIVQQAHIQAFRRISTFQPRAPDSFRRWIATIALHKLRDAVRNRLSLKRGSGSNAIAGAAVPHGEPKDRDESFIALLDMVQGTDHTPSRSVARHEAVAAVESAVAALPDDQRQAVSLVYLEGCSVAVAATMMGRSEQAVHGLCYRARGRLRNFLGSRSRFLGSRD